MDTIIAIFGKKQSGKGSATKFITGHYLVKNGKIHSYNISPAGDLLVKFTPEDDYHVMDLDSNTQESWHWFSNNLWPTCKTFSFAGELKMAVSRLFGIDMKLLKGTDKEKNSKTNIEWNRMEPFLKRKQIDEMKKDGKWFEKLTIRELLQYFGSDLIRAIDDEAWCKCLMRDVRTFSSAVSLIDDGRFPNEHLFLLNSKEMKGYKVVTILLTRDMFKDNHSSELSVDELDKTKFTAVIDNQNLSIPETHNIIKSLLVSQGVW